MGNRRIRVTASRAGHRVIAFFRCDLDAYRLEADFIMSGWETRVDYL